MKKSSKVENNLIKVMGTDMDLKLKAITSVFLLPKLDTYTLFTHFMTKQPFVR